MLPQKVLVLLLLYFVTAHCGYGIRKSFDSEDCQGTLLNIDTRITDACFKSNGKHQKIQCVGDKYIVYECSGNCTECVMQRAYPTQECSNDDGESVSYHCYFDMEKDSPAQYVDRNFMFSQIIDFLPLDYLQYHYKLAESSLKATSNMISSENCPSYAALIGCLGSAFGLVFANSGAAAGIAISFRGYISLGRKGRLMLIKGLVPSIMASVRGVYGLIISILIAVQINNHNYSLAKAFAHLFSGLSVGLTGLASGWCMGVLGDHGMTAVSRQPRLYIGILLILIFAEALGLYGLIIGLVLLSSPTPNC